VLARALPSWAREEAKLPAEWNEVPTAVWRICGAVAGPVAFGCRLCAAGRTGTVARVVRYAPRWEQVCVRHGRWLLDAGADQPHEYLDVRDLPEVAAAQRRWARVARRAVRGRGRGRGGEGVRSGACGGGPVVGEARPLRRAHLILPSGLNVRSFTSPRCPFKPPALGLLLTGAGQGQGLSSGSA